MAGALNGAVYQWGHVKAGHVAADRFLAAHKGDLVQRSFVDFREMHGERARANSARVWVHSHLRETLLGALFFPVTSVFFLPIRIGINEPRRDHQFGGILNAHIQFDHVFFG